MVRRLNDVRLLGKVEAETEHLGKVMLHKSSPHVNEQRATLMKMLQKQTDDLDQLEQAYETQLAQCSRRTARATASALPTHRPSCVRASWKPCAVKSDAKSATPSSRETLCLGRHHCGVSSTTRLATRDSSPAPRSERTTTTSAPSVSTLTSAMGRAA